MERGVHLAALGAGCQHHLAAWVPTSIGPDLVELVQRVRQEPGWMAHAIQEKIHIELTIYRFDPADAARSGLDLLIRNLLDQEESGVLTSFLVIPAFPESICPRTAPPPSTLGLQRSLRRG